MAWNAGRKAVQTKDFMKNTFLMILPQNDQRVMGKAIYLGPFNAGRSDQVAFLAATAPETHLTDKFAQLMRS